MELVGPDEDGDHLVVQTEGGEQFRLPVTENLRTVLAPAQSPEVEVSDDLSPKDVQRRMRAGMSAEEIAESTGMEVERIRRFEGPILAERRYIAELAQGTRVSREVGAPTLGEAVADRLSRRGVQARAIVWDAQRSGHEPWRVSATYPLAGGHSSAAWTFEPAAHIIRAADEEARWFLTTDPFAESEPPRHLAAVQEDGPADVALHTLEQKTEKPTTDELLDQLQRTRGTRQAVDIPAMDEDFEGFGPQYYQDSPRPDTAEHSVPPRQSIDATRSDSSTPAEPDTGLRARRKGRTSVPRWDDVMFGSQSE